MDKEVERKIVEEFYKTIVASHASKTVEWECRSYVEKHNTKRRDFVWAMCCFLDVLIALEKETGIHYHRFRDVVRETEKRFNLCPSDHPFLHTKWDLTQVPLKVFHKEHRKFIGINPRGRDFVKNLIKVKTFFYTEPITKVVLWSGSETDYETIKRIGMEEKEDDDPFFKKED